MNRWLRRVALTAALLPVAGGLSACSSETEGIREVQDAIQVTRLQPLRFRYTVTTPETGAFQVQGLIEDDFRYKARLLRGSTPVFDEVVNDDAIAVRFADPELLGAYIDDEQRDIADLDTNLAGVNVVSALQAKRWVLDYSGAPSLTDASRATRNRGTDPVFDALGAFAYVEQAMRESFEVHKFSEDDLNPAYRASEDVFPRPERDSGIERYDLRRPFLPPIGQTGAAGDALPSTKHFRKMAIYVKNGQIVRVMERVEVTGRAASDFVGYLAELAREAGVPEEEIEAGKAELEGLNESERSTLLLQVLNQVLEVSGNEPVTIRTMTFDVLDVGDDDIEAALPTDVIEGSLAILVNRGAKQEATASTSGTPGEPPTSRTGDAADEGADAADATDEDDEEQ